MKIQCRLLSTQPLHFLLKNTSLSTSHFPSFPTRTLSGGNMRTKRLKSCPYLNKNSNNRSSNSICSPSATSWSYSHKKLWAISVISTPSSMSVSPCLKYKLLTTKLCRNTIAPFSCTPFIKNCWKISPICPTLMKFILIKKVISSRSSFVLTSSGELPRTRWLTRPKMFLWTRALAFWLKKYLPKLLSFRPVLSLSDSTLSPWLPHTLFQSWSRSTERKRKARSCHKRYLRLWRQPRKKLRS